MGSAFYPSTNARPTRSRPVDSRRDTATHHQLGEKTMPPLPLQRIHQQAPVGIFFHLRICNISHSMSQTILRLMNKHNVQR